MSVKIQFNLYVVLSASYMIYFMLLNISIALVIWKYQI